MNVGGGVPVEPLREGQRTEVKTVHIRKLRCHKGVEIRMDINRSDGGAILKGFGPSSHIKLPVTVKEECWLLGAKRWRRPAVHHSVEVSAPSRVGSEQEAIDQHLLPLALTGKISNAVVVTAEIDLGSCARGRE